MKSSTRRSISIFVGGVLTTVVIMNGSTIMSFFKRDTNQGKGIMDYTADSIYDSFIASDFEKLSDNQQRTQTLINSKENFKNDQEVLYFFKQLEIQTKEYTEDYISIDSQTKTRILSNKAKEEIKKLINILDHFILNGEPYKGKTFKSLAPEIQIQLHIIGTNMYFMLEKGYPMEKEDLIEWKDAVEDIASIWVKGKTK